MNNSGYGLRISSAGPRLSPRRNEAPVAPGIPPRRGSFGCGTGWVGGDVVAWGDACIEARSDPDATTANVNTAARIALELFTSFRFS
jgi:hypothetical protein